ncbi:alpha/beta hydrolase [Reichenbachiella agarivorans]|uniref:Alpha/beta hydrolase n=1 Tax=Reichenbachiella agarivorans TaxID=2979464 RepID=A0ABY6CPD3_9BACT|nr:alpha/beta hydrolase [Reichenbachiella agarivorans]UXP32377.1 alpha/beta hydrolase [Reichenbachiella agarivorans]
MGLFSLLSQSLLAQDFPRDTSYTTHSAYLKYQKEYPQIEIVKAKMDSSITIQRDVVYHHIGDRALHLDLYAQAISKERRLPLIVLIHGGGWVSGDRSMLEPMAMRMAHESFATATVEYRLSPEEQYPAAVQDIKLAIRWLKWHADELGIDSSRVAVLGSSAGGQLATLVGYSDGFAKFELANTDIPASSKVQAVIDIDGILAFHHPESKEGKVAGLWIGGTYEQVPTLWEEASALSHAGAGDPPTLFINSSFPRFHAGQDDVIKIFNHYDIDTEVCQIENSPHSFWLFDPWFERTVDSVLVFLNQVFPSENDNDDSRK